MPLVSIPDPAFMYPLLVPYNKNTGWSWGKGEIFDWAETHCKGKYTANMSMKRLQLTRGTDWTFQFNRDRTLFALRWCS